MLSSENFPGLSEYFAVRLKPDTTSETTPPYCMATSSISKTSMPRGPSPLPP